MMKKLLLAAFTLLSLPALAQQKTLIIDAGHGGQDYGSIAADGVSESYINYLFAEDLKKAATAAGFKVVLTHPDNTTYPTLEERAALIKQHPGKTYFISLHANSSTNLSATGAQVIYDAASGVANGSKAWAETVSNLLAPKAGKSEVVTNKLRVLTDSPVPAIAVEVGYMTNLEDLQKLETITYREEVAKLLVESIK